MPIREELFGVERLEAHARSLAASQSIMSRRDRAQSLSARLADNGAALLFAYRTNSEAADKGQPITPAAEWLVDNYHLVERQFREVRSDLPPGYYRQLPKLAEGPFIGYPRIFGIAWAFVAHTDSRFDSELLRRFLLAYQEVQPLTIGELWALSITLRIVLIENLRRLADLIVLSREDRERANTVADRILGSNGQSVEPVEIVLAGLSAGDVSNAFAVQIVRRLHDQDLRIIPALAWLEERLAERDSTVDKAVSEEHQRQATGTVTISNIINSLRVITSVDWSDVFESISLVDRVLTCDPAYQTMDFATRNLYRNAVEALARGSSHSEIEVARRSLSAVGAGLVAVDAGQPANTRGPGYHLVGGGRRAFERSLGFRPDFSAYCRRGCRRLGIGGYAGAVVVVTAIMLLAALGPMASAGVGIAALIVLGALAVIPISDSAVALVNCLVSRLIGPVTLPGLELKDKIPADCRTLVAVPTLLTSPASVAEHIEGLEVHQLASPDGALSFALLTDWTDAPQQDMPGDQSLLTAAADGIAGLNQRYPSTEGKRFHLLHRRRTWNESQRCWMGWERKRGKLHELNRLLRGATDTGFVAVEGELPSLPADVRFVITLDADTRLPRETVRKLIGKMAHPLNAPRFDAGGGRVVEGYGVLQPRVTPALSVGEEGSLYQRTYSSPSGIDPYAAAVSDVYQDLLDEGSFAGKGIYDVDTFEAALAGRVPESTLLSHDLFEGTFARAGLASDVEVIEDFPARYDVASLRQHRWVRGDWQLLPWILGYVPVAGDLAGGHRPPPAAGRWKMIDNLRRSLSAPFAVGALLAGWMLPYQAALAWTLLVLLMVVAPAIVPILCTLKPARAGVPLIAHLRTLATDFSFALTQSLFILVFLADQAWLMADAIVRTLYRLYVSRRLLLEWVSHAQTVKRERPGLPMLARRMAGGLAIALIAALIAIWQPGNAWLAAPFIVAWLASPALAAFASLPPAVAGKPFVWVWQAFPALARWASLSPVIEGKLPVTAEQATALRLTARRTFRFFETFVTPTDMMLPPDNFQEDPVPALAHRTSPTNIGLYLLSVVAARDFGWIGTTDAVERLEATLATTQRMERVRGHLYNWYDTRTLAPLEPKYISSVDSGNLAGHLIAVARACHSWLESGPGRLSVSSGVADAAAMAVGELRRVYADSEIGLPEVAVLRADLERLAHFSASGVDLELLEQTVADVQQLCDRVRHLPSAGRVADSGDLVYWTDAIKRCLESHRRDVASERSTLDARLAAIEGFARDNAMSMEFGFLLDPDRKLLSIGYLAHEDRLDPSCYDLIASEARLASFFAIAKGDIPARHWFRLGRSITLVARRAALISWSGSMFEYLMPSLVMRAPTGSLIEQTSRLIVRRQIDYGAERGVPWGISESAYNVRDLELTYQYSNFGVPGLGLKRGLDANVVVAPYATALAAMVDPQAAVRNLDALARVGGLGRYGYYEALDYTPARLPATDSVAVVRAFMAHHQGMTVVAIANTLLDAVMRTRFHSEPIIQATELLLQERPPRDVAVARPSDAYARSAARVRNFDLVGGRKYSGADTATPATHLLSNGTYSVMLTTAGAGYSRCGDIAITRWREDPTCDDWGSFIYLRDIASGRIWSAGMQPCGVGADDYEVSFIEDRAAIVRRDGTLTTTLEVLVPSGDNAEVRQVSIVNDGSAARDIEVTSFAELVLTTQGADVAHTAFAKLSVQTEFLSNIETIIATRRRRSPGEPEIWAAHLAVVHGETISPIEVETDRMRFLGRGNSARNADAVNGNTLSNTTGTVLDPVFALRRTVRIAPGGTARIDYWTIVAASREALMDSIDQHRDETAFARAATLAWTQALVQLHHIGVDRGEAALFQRLAGHLLYSGSAMRAAPETIARGAGPQSGLWSLSISGDLPILLLRIADSEHLELARQLLLAHEYFRMKNFNVDLVIVNERGASYVQDLQLAIESLVRTSKARRPAVAGGTGNVYVVRADLMTAETRALLLSVARAVLVGQRGSLADQLDRIPAIVVPRPVVRVSAGEATEPAPISLPDLEFANGLGGFADGGREYVVVLPPGRSTPAPWINVIANAAFGFQVAAEGGGFTWAAISRENQLTPWSNDPVSNRCGEAIYIRDEGSHAFWSATASPIRLPAVTYVARHGHGYSRFEHTANDIGVDLMQFVPIDDPVKISRLRLTNQSNRPRALTVTSYAEWVLGTARSSPAALIISARDEPTGALLARNPWSPAFPTRVAFCDLGGRQTEWTADRGEFIGRNGSLERPAALAIGAPLSGRVGAALDPCGAMRTVVTVPPGETVEIIALLGQAATVEEVRALVAKYRAADLDAVMQEVRDHWHGVLQRVQVRTPDRAMDILLNGWLLYQSLACRVWARAAFYQASGAYGFRDQLQDGMALVSVRPDLARAHLLHAASRQFIEGDVQHWWFPNTGLGVRSRISDDRAWLALCTAHYIEVTGEMAVLDEQVAFIEGPWLRDGEHDSLFLPVVSDRRASLYEHCALAVDNSLKLGAHGLPLIGTGDWNDGMNRVGENGRGESVWLAWLHCATIAALVPLATARGDHERAARWLAHADELRQSIEREAWDGDWYRRGFFDDGTPLGSSLSEECKIDSIAQSWSVISGAAEPARSRQAMAAVERELILPAEQLLMLFKPPFDQTVLEPGYIKGYPPGIRENGGQYTHGALWSVIAFAMLGEGDKAAALFSLLNPINHARSPAEVARYIVEPYVVAADVYSQPPHVGRGGWTWYTGSAGWMQRAGIENILGLRIAAGRLRLDPCIPKDWPGFNMQVMTASGTFDITVSNPRGICRGIAAATLDGKDCDVADGSLVVEFGEGVADRKLEVVMGASDRGQTGTNGPSRR